jgi:MFS family permease
MIIAAATVWGLAVAAAGYAHNLWLAFACLAIAGGADMVSGIFRSTIWNQTIPDHIRGRLAGIELLSYSLGPQVGQLRASLFAQWFTLRRAIISGGFLCVIGTSISAATLRSFWNYDDRTNEHACREREIRAMRSA